MMDRRDSPPDTLENSHSLYRRSPLVPVIIVDGRASRIIHTLSPVPSVDEQDCRKLATSKVGEASLKEGAHPFLGVPAVIGNHDRQFSVA
jgi:hypothetical protein